MAERRDLLTLEVRHCLAFEAERLRCHESEHEAFFGVLLAGILETCRPEMIVRLQIIRLALIASTFLE